MLRIDCPHCGPRAEHEFRWRGDMRVARPAPDAAADDPAWLDHLYWRPALTGEIEELWFHVGGCRQFMVVRRDVNSHAIRAVRPADGRR